MTGSDSTDGKPGSRVATPTDVLSAMVAQERSLAVEEDEARRALFNLRKVTQRELEETIRLHGLYQKGRAGGQRANLGATDLRHLDLTERDLTGADLSGANLEGARMLAAVFHSKP